MVSRRAARRVTALLASVAAALVLLPSTFADAQPVPHRVVVVGLPAPEAERFLASHPAGVGLGVFPESRDPLRFVREVGYGTPHGTSISAGDGKPFRVGDALAEAGREVEALGGSSPVGRALDEAFSPTTPVAHPSASPARLTVRSLDRAAALSNEIAGAASPTDYVVLGVGPRTPLLIGICRDPCRGQEGPIGTLDGGIARRPAIATPYDVGVTVMGLLGVPRPSEGFAGNVLSTRGKPGAMSYALGLERRLARDATLGSSVAVLTATLTVVGLVAGLLLLVAGKRRVAQRTAQGAWSTVAIGYLCSLFVPSGRGEIRSLVVVAAFVIGASLAPERDVRTARVFFAVAVAAALLFVVAPLNPGGEPGLSIWGNPLTSWRFFGMQNAQAGTVAAGVVVWGVLAGLGVAALTATAILAAFVIGAPTIGANFVGVLTFTFGAALALLALSRRTVRPVHVVIAGAVAIGAFLLALLADVGSPVSHGGRAAKRISEGGISTAWDFVTGRLRLNIDLIRGFFGGVVWVAVMLVALALMIAWGARVSSGPLRGRAAVWAGALMALSSLVLEDSGFYSGMTLLGAALAAWIMVSSRITEFPRTPSAGDG